VGRWCVPSAPGTNRASVASPAETGRSG
jgi:hypothetical protein